METIVNKQLETLRSNGFAKSAIRSAFAPRSAMLEFGEVRNLTSKTLSAKMKTPS
jgi:hypothetical protein